MIGSRFNVPVEQINYFPQELSTNRSGAWSRMEDEWAKNAQYQRARPATSTIPAVPAVLPQIVRVEINCFELPASTTRRPDRFDVKYWYNNAPQRTLPSALPPNTPNSTTFIIPN